MHRRQFLQATASATALATLPTLGFDRATGASSWKQQFDAALAQQPWLAGFKNTASGSFAASAKLTGNLPEALRGTLFRNGPAQHELGDFRWQHWFDGDGMLQAYRLTDTGVQHQARMIETPKYLAEKQAGRPLYSGFGTAVDSSAVVTGPDSLNVANISVLPHHGKLYALWEAGSATAMNPNTLETIGFHAFSEETDGVPFSAHPRIDPDGTLWNFGYVSSESLLVFWHINARGAVQRTGILPVEHMSMPHDFVVTENHLVIMIPPFWYSPDAAAARSFLDNHRWQSDQPTQVLVIDKNDFSKFKRYELPPQWVFHFGNAWEDQQGIIRFDGARSTSPQVMTQGLREVMRGVQVPAPPSEHYLYRIDTRAGTIAESSMLGKDSRIESEFPTIDGRVSGQRYQQLIMLTADSANPTPHGRLNAVSRYDLDRQQLDTFTYPISHIPEEHLFVAKPGSQPEREGWVVGSAYDFSNDRTELNVFDAHHLADGPLCTATLPYGLPMGLHGKFTRTAYGS